MKPFSPGRAAPSVPASLRFALSATALVLAAAASSPLAAQSVAAAADSSPAPRVAPASSLSPAMTREIYVAAFRSSARQWCAAGSGTALDDALASTRTVVRASVADGERPAVERALDDSHAELASAGGCAALARPTNFVVVDRFEGHRWCTARRDIAPRDHGRRSEDGYTIVTRRTKIGTRRFHRLAAEADFTFTTQREELVRGRYRVPASDGEVAERWATVESAIAAQYPTLRVVRSTAPRRASDRGAREAQGDGVPADSAVRAWATSFVNPDTQALEVRIFALPAGGDRGDWVIVVDYLGFAGR